MSDAHDDTPPPPQFDVQEKQSILEQIRAEVEDLKHAAQAFGPESIKDGSWFNKFIQSMLGSYAERIVAQGGVQFFRNKYPGLGQDQIADKLITLAVRYAALAGGASGATSSAAVAATIGTAGAAGVAMPAVVTAIVSEMLYTTRLQVRLVYDLSLLYGYPIDPSDPEDLYRAFCLAYGVSWASGQTGMAVKAAAPEIARAKIRGILQGSAPVIQRIAKQLLGPRLGRAITQKALLQTAVPVVGIGIASGWNYMSTSGIGSIAKHDIRSRGYLRDSVRRTGAQLRTLGPEAVIFLRAILALSTADGDFGAPEQETYDEVLRHLALPPQVLEQLEQQVEVNVEGLIDDLRTVREESMRDLFAEGLAMVCVADGVVHEQEIPLLGRMHVALERPLDLEALRERSKMFRRKQGRMEHAARAVSGAVGTAGKAVAGAASTAGQAMLGFGKSMKSMFSRAPIAETAAPPPTPPTLPTPTVSETPTRDAPGAEDARLHSLMERMKQLAAMKTAGLISDEEFAAKKQEILAAL